MIKAELKHNPYLLTTEVKFNGRAPRINCRIEKYENKPLKDWVNLIPSIFYDEMNGYDFDFEFTGTAPDFNEIKEAFQGAGVSEKSVRLLHKNEIEDSMVKTKEIGLLLEWLQNNRNRTFDYESFVDDYKDLFESSYPYLIIDGDLPSYVGEEIAPEVISKLSELDGMDLENIPIVFCIREDNRMKIRTILMHIMSKIKTQKIREEQLFFQIDSDLDKSQVTRTIFDLGVKKPQIVQSFQDPIILSYIQNYPITQYIRDVINIFSENQKIRKQSLEEKTSKSREANKSIYERIEQLEVELKSLNQADEDILQRDNYFAPAQLQEAKQEFINLLMKWKNFKSKVIGNYEAEVMAEDYNYFINKQIKQFCNKVEAIYSDSCHSIKEFYEAVYRKTGIEQSFQISDTSTSLSRNDMGINVVSSLLELREVQRNEGRNDFFGFFKVANEESPRVAETIIFYMEKWRMKAIELVMPLLDEYIRVCSENLMHQYDNLADEYHSHIQELIASRMEEKESVSDKLSVEEQKLQDDWDWYHEVQSMIIRIERD